MKQQPDQLFQQKLEPLNLAPSAAAWDKIEKNLDRKKYPVWMWRAAAGFVLISVVGITLLTQEQPDPATVAMDETAAEVSPAATPDTPKQPVIDTLTHINSTPATKPEKPKAKATKPQQKQSKPIKITEPLLAVLEVEPAEVKPQDISEPVITVSPKEITTEVTPAASTAIVYSVEEVNQKFLLTNNTTQATSDEKKPSTFQKLLAKVQDLKTNEDPMGKLRQKKNEILALNFNKEKREQNN